MLRPIDNHLELGKVGEDAAADFLAAKGWLIKARNWRQGPLELDLICQQEQTIVFVEVKTRRAGGLTGPAEAFSREKQRRLLNAARAWQAENNAWAMDCRFDLVLVTSRDHNLHLELVSDVIQLETGNPVRGGHSHWQPW